MIPAHALKNAARGLLIGLLVLAPICTGRLQDWESLVALLAACLAGLLWLVGGGRLLPTRWLAADVLLCLAFVACAVATRWTVYLYDSVLYLSLFGGGLMAFLLVRAALAAPEWKRAAWWSLSVGALVAGLWGLREYTTNALIAGDPSWRSFGPFYNPNCLGGYLGLCLPAPVALALGAQTRGGLGRESARPSKRKGKRAAPEPPAPRYAEIAGMTIAVVLGLALLSTGSKGAMLGVVGAIIMFALIGASPGTSMGRVLRWGAGIVLVAALVAAFTFPPIRSRLQGLLTSQQHSSSFRVFTWQGTLGMIGARPLTGFGPGSFAHAYPRYARAGFTRQAHQTPLQLAAECGVPAALLLLGGIAASLLVIIRGLLTNQDSPGAARGSPKSRGPRDSAATESGGFTAASTRLLAVAGAAGVVGFWVHNMVDYTWYVVAHHMVLWCMLGLAWPRREDAAPVAAGGWSRRVVALVLAGGLAWTLTALASEQALTQGRRYARMGALRGAETFLHRVLPMNAYRWVDMSRIYERRGAEGDIDALKTALAYRLTAVEQQPTEPTHYNALGRICVALGELSDEGYPAQGLAYLQTGLRVYPTSTEMLAALGRIQEQLGKRREAVKTYERLVALYDTPVRTSQAVQYFVDDNYLYAFVALAERAWDAGREGEALKLAGTGLRVAGDYLMAQRRYRQILELSGRYDTEHIARVEGLADRARAVLERLGTPLARLRVGIALHKMDRLEEAVGVLDELVVELHAGDDVGHRAVAAYAALRLGACHKKLENGPAARRATGEGLRLAEQVLEALTEKLPASMAGWDDEDAARFGAMARAARRDAPARAD